MWTEGDRRIGVGAAASVAAIGLVYVAVGALGVAMRPDGMAALAQVDPYLALLEVLIMLSAVAAVAAISAVYAFADNEVKTAALASFGFAVAFAALTCTTHFVSLAVGRNVDADAAPMLAAHLSLQTWPNILLAVDLLAWDVLLGLALLFAAPVFGGDPLRRLVRYVAVAGGALCLAGAAGPLSGDMRLQYLAIAGYAVVFPVWCALLAILFARTPAHR
jgi:hypothetical protein